MKDYYQILEVTPQSQEEEIRKSYRKLAMQYHPDRNPDNPGAEEKFKEIAEAYGVLTDPVKRRQYDSARAMGGNYQAGGSDFNYSQEDILKDLFQDPQFQQMFQGLLQEFARRGFSANQHFIQRAFFGGKGGFVIGGLFLFGSLAGPAIMNSAKKSISSEKGLLRSITQKVGNLLTGGSTAPATQGEESSHNLIEDTSYTAYLSEAEFREGKTIQLVTQGETGQEKLKVKIPPGSRSGQKLRLAGKGISTSKGRGDLYLCLAAKSQG